MEKNAVKQNTTFFSDRNCHLEVLGSNEPIEVVFQADRYVDPVHHTQSMVNEGRLINETGFPSPLGYAVKPLALVCIKSQTSIAHRLNQPAMPAAATLPYDCEYWATTHKSMEALNMIKRCGELSIKHSRKYSKAPHELLRLTVMLFLSPGVTGAAFCLIF